MRNYFYPGGTIYEEDPPNGNRQAEGTSAGLLGDVTDRNARTPLVANFAMGQKRPEIGNGYQYLTNESVKPSPDSGYAMIQRVSRTNPEIVANAITNMRKFANTYRNSNSINGRNLTDDEKTLLGWIADTDFNKSPGSWENDMIHDYSTLMAELYPTFFTKDKNNGGRTLFGENVLNAFNSMREDESNHIYLTRTLQDAINQKNAKNKSEELVPLGQNGGLTHFGVYINGVLDDVETYDQSGNWIPYTKIPDNLKFSKTGDRLNKKNEAYTMTYDPVTRFTFLRNEAIPIKAYGGYNNRGYNRYDDGGMMPPDQGMGMPPDQGMGGGSPVDQVLAMLSQLPPDQLQQVVQALMQMAQGGGMPPQGGMPPEGMMAYGGYNRYANGGNISRRTSMAFGNYLKKKGY